MRKLFAMQMLDGFKYLPHYAEDFILFKSSLEMLPFGERMLTEIS